LVRHVEPLELGSTVERFRDGVRDVVAALPELVVGAVAEQTGATIDRLAADGVPVELARAVAVADAALVALPAVALGEEHGVDPRDVARLQLQLDDALGLDRVRDRIAALPRSDRWQTEARAALRDEFYESQHALTAAVLVETDAGLDAPARVERWLADHSPATDRYRTLVADADRTEPGDLAALAVVRRALRDLATAD
jgi:glutamate dehydrogenase